MTEGRTAGRGLREATFPLVLAGPSGSGKTTVGRALERLEEVTFSVSATTRPARPEEEDGVDYHFHSRAAFEELLERDELLEWAEVHGELYGTPRSNLVEARRRGSHLLLDIDVQGARSVRERVPETVTVFLIPPDGRRIVRRLLERGTEDEAQLRRRLAAAEEELEAVGEFDYVVVNDRLQRAVDAVEEILRSEERRTVRMARSVQETASGLAAEIRRAVEEELGATAARGRD